MGKLRALAAIAVLAVLAGCDSSGTPSPKHTFGDASSAISALSNALVFALSSNKGGAAFTGSAGFTGRGAVGIPYVFTFVGFSSGSPTTTAPYTLDGSMTEVSTSPNSLNGTINFSGGEVTQIIWNGITTSPANGGTYVIVFSGGGTYTYDLATGTFTQN
jgi:hypothetical protein